MRSVLRSAVGVTRGIGRMFVGNHAIGTHVRIATLSRIVAHDKVALEASDCGSVARYDTLRIIHRRELREPIVT